MKNEYWRLTIIEDFNYCYSCDEECGHMWFVSVAFDTETHSPVCINTKPVDGGVELVPEGINFWTPKECSTVALERQINKFTDASELPRYKLKDFCKGGLYEKGILKHNKKMNSKYEKLGLPALCAEPPEKILIPQ